MVDKETNPLKAIKNDELRSRTPDFLQKNSGFLNKVKGQNRGEAAGTLGEAEKSASSSAPSVDVQNGTNRGGLYAGKGQTGQAGKKSKSKMRIAKGPSLAIIGLVLVAMIVIIPSIPFIAIGAIDHNLQDALGFSGTGAIIEKLALRIMSEKASKGEVPTKIASDFAKNGILFGQVTETGGFVRTDKYIANIENDLEVAATGFDYYEHGEEGELSVLYNGKVIDADDLVLAVESDPEMYADYSEALDVKTRFFYNTDNKVQGLKSVQEVYDDLGLNRAEFYDWETTEDFEEDFKNFLEKISNILKEAVSAVIAGCDDEDDECDSRDFTGEGAINDAINVTNDTKNAAQLLNMAVSAIEPQKAARVFLAIEEPIQRARIDGSGPVNPLMNALNRQTEINYVDVNTNEQVTVKKSILETTNFAAAISGGGYSKSEANNFSRDRVLIATGVSSDGGVQDTIKKSTLEDETISSPTAVLGKGYGGVNADAIDKAKDSVKRATEEIDDERFTSVIGGNMAISGGSYLSNAITQHVLGAMPSDAETISEYQQEVDDILARKANAERASRSPFDISSSNTFLGNIVNRLAISYLNHSSRGDSGFMSAVGTIADLTNDSASNLLGDAMADGNDLKFTTIAGDCTTAPEAANVVGSLYCGTHNTIVTKFFDYTREQWINTLSGLGLQENGMPESGGELAKFITNGADREATVGVQSATVCKAWHDENDNTFQGAWNGFLDFIGAYKVCDGVNNEDPGVATGAKYTFSSSNPYRDNAELFAGYILYDEVDALVSETESNISLFREKYYAEHPKDNSVAGRIARYSGMTKAEAEIAIGYASYLAKLRNYDPLQRYAFNIIDLNIKTPPLIVDDTEIKETIYCYWQSKIEFSDLRNRNQVA
ncbi:hypothetical protein IKG10_00815 [Candidatus Saccharibacteria bacterium]|nr:hypothetical protein [Candidatus Saccharibacteria bacterium]